MSTLRERIRQFTAKLADAQGPYSTRELEDALVLFMLGEVEHSGELRAEAERLRPSPCGGCGAPGPLLPPETHEMLCWSALCPRCAKREREQAKAFRASLMSEHDLRAQVASTLERIAKSLDRGLELDVERGKKLDELGEAFRSILKQTGAAPARGGSGLAS